MNEKFRRNTSYWTFYFLENERNLNSVIKESVFRKSDGSVRIELDIVTYEKEFIDHLEKNKPIVKVLQEFHLMDRDGETSDKISYTYENMSVDEITINAGNDIGTKVVLNKI